MREGTSHTLASWQAVVGEWAVRTFGPGERLAAHIEHMRRELNEIEAAPPEALGEELADVLSLLLATAHRHGLDLEAALAAKFARNRTRRWGVPDAAGVIEHIRET